MGSGYSSEEEQETQVANRSREINLNISLQDKKTSIMETEDVIANDFGGREQGDGMEKEEEQPVQTYEDKHKHLSKSTPLDVQEKQVEDPPLCQSELLNSGPPVSAPSNVIRKPAPGPSMESAGNIIRKPAGLLLPEAGGLVISKLPPIHDDVDLRPTHTVC